MPMTFSKALLSASAILMGVMGLGTTFMADDLLRHVRQPEAPILMLFVQTIGALYLAFAMLNWMLRGVTAGGIYARPLIVANLVHFLMVAIVLLRWAATGAPPGILVLAALFTILALSFGALMFRDPVGRA
jgi:hypothetical protein